MNVYILTEGGADIGIGHVTRCLSLYQAFEEKGISPALIVNGDGSIKNLLIGKHHEFCNWLETDKLSGFTENADVVIIDSYLAGYTIYDTISKTARVPVYIDDNKRIIYPRGIVVNGTIFADSLGYPPKENTAYFLGSRYIPLRKDFWEAAEKEIQKDLQSVLITFGGDDIRDLTPGVLKIVNSSFPEFSKIVVIGRGFRNIPHIETLQDKKTELVFFPDAEGMKKVMLESDIALSAAGQTLYELARIGVPTIAIAAADNQMNNVHGWQRAGFIEYAGWWEERDILAKVIRSIRVLRDQHTRQQRSITGKTFVDGQGARRIIEEVIRLTR